jgi:hypothetical protein
MSSGWAFAAGSAAFGREGRLGEDSAFVGAAEVAVVAAAEEAVLAWEIVDIGVEARVEGEVGLEDCRWAD